MKRQYGLFRRKRGEKKWERLFPSVQLTKEVAIKHFQSALLNGTMDGYEMALRPVPAG